MHICSSLLVSCIDFRVQRTVEEWARKNLGERQYDRVALAGGVKNRDVILGQVDLSVRLHEIKKVVLMNHEDCGAYGSEGTEKKHQEDLRAMCLALRNKYPMLAIETYYVKLDGSVSTTA